MYMYCIIFTDYQSMSDQEITTINNNNAEEIDLMELLLAFTIQGSELKPPELIDEEIEETTIMPVIRTRVLGTILCALFT